MFLWVGVKGGRGRLNEYHLFLNEGGGVDLLKRMRSYFFYFQLQVKFKNS